MAAAARGNGEDAPGADLYAVLGLNRECTDAELKVAYRRLAMIWHPDRCSATGSSARVEEAKERFQEIQEAYSVLSDSNKRFLYDVGVYDSEDDDDGLSGMGDFLGEMADMMSQAAPTETFEELQQLFVDMFQDDIVAAAAGICSGGGTAHPRPAGQQQRGQSKTGSCTSSAPRRQQPPPAARTGNNTRAPLPPNGFSKRGRAGLSPGLGLSGLCFKVTTETRQRAAPVWTHDVRSGGGGGGGGEGRSRRKQRLSTSRGDVSSGGLSRQPSRASSWQ